MFRRAVFFLAVPGSSDMKAYCLGFMTFAVNNLSTRPLWVGSMVSIKFPWFTFNIFISSPVRGHSSPNSSLYAVIKTRNSYNTVSYYSVTHALFINRTLLFIVTSMASIFVEHQQILLQHQVPQPVARILDRLIKTVMCSFLCTMEVWLFAH